MTLLLSAVQDVRHLTPATAARYQHAASSAALVAVLGTGMPVEPAEGVRGGLLRPTDPLAEEWVVTVVAPHFAGALVAREVREAVPGGERRFDYVLTYDRELVLRVAAALVRRVPGGGALGRTPAPVLPAVVAGPAPEGDLPVPVAGGADEGTDVAHLRSAFDGAPIGMAVLTTSGVVVRCNAALARLLGRPAAQLLGGDLFGVTHEEDREPAHAACASLSTGRTTTTQHVRLLRADGVVLPVTVTTSRVEATADADVHLVMHVQDARAQRALERELTHRALHDTLTGLPHRSLFLDRLEHSLRGAARSGRSTSVLFVDLDGFKAVNDTHGHHAGDLVLVEVAHRVSAVLRPGDTAARWGGDEFTVLCEGADRAQAEGVAHRLRHEISRPLRVAGTEVVVHATVGTACSAELEAGADGATLLRVADGAMYRAKSASR
jgi:diguanylate cyclase (GGDEF)-like protein/PAS domain S-box-containing protein